MSGFDLLELADDEIAVESKTDWINGTHKHISPLDAERIAMGEMDINVHGNHVPLEIPEYNELSEVEDSITIPDIGETNIDQHFELLDDIFSASGKKSILEMSGQTAEQVAGMSAAVGNVFVALKSKATSVLDTDKDVPEIAPPKVAPIQEPEVSVVQNAAKVIVLPTAAFAAVKEIQNNKELSFASVEEDRGAVLGTGANPGMSVSRMPSRATGAQLRS